VVSFPFLESAWFLAAHDLRDAECRNLRATTFLGGNGQRSRAGEADAMSEGGGKRNSRREGHSEMRKWMPEEPQTATIIRRSAEQRTISADRTIVYPGERLAIWDFLWINSESRWYGCSVCGGRSIGDRSDTFGGLWGWQRRVRELFRLEILVRFVACHSYEATSGEGAGELAFADEDRVLSPALVPNKDLRTSAAPGRNPFVFGVSLFAWVGWGNLCSIGYPAGGSSDPSSRPRYFRSWNEADWPCFERSGCIGPLPVYWGGASSASQIRAILWSWGTGGCTEKGRPNYSDCPDDRAGDESGDRRKSTGGDRLGRWWIYACSTSWLVTLPSEPGARIRQLGVDSSYRVIDAVSEAIMAAEAENLNFRAAKSVQMLRATRTESARGFTAIAQDENRWAPTDNDSK